MPLLTAWKADRRPHACRAVQADPQKARKHTTLVEGPVKTPCHQTQAGHTSTLP